MSVQHKPAAAWSRDSLAAWQWMLDNTTPNKEVGTDPKYTQIRFLERWAAKILCLVNEEMGWCDWYWFLSRHFERELLRVDPYHKPLREIMFTAGDWETDPSIEKKA